MSGLQTGLENPTELRLDYKDLLAGRLVIVIHGLPDADHKMQTPGADERASSPKGSTYGRSHGSASSPLIDEAEAITDATGYAPALFTTLLLAAWRGREALTLELIATMIEEATADEAGRATVLTEYAKAVLYNGLGRYEHAVAAAQRACAHEDLGFFGWPRLELVEACARRDTRAVATDALSYLKGGTRAGRTDWVLGVWARSAALLNDGDAAEALYREAIERFKRGRIAVHLARAQLVYGEWLRRQNRRVDAREQLRPAYDTFNSIGVEAFAERTRRELVATGETARRRSDDSRGILTPQEAQIARLARDGFSNPEIGAQLFISSRTVQYHLRKVFRKLDISSRNQLGRTPSSRLDLAQTSAVAPRLATALAPRRMRVQPARRDPRTVTNARTPIREAGSW
jgi:DNA-binding CsgD family transcriptional regulator